MTDHDSVAAHQETMQLAKENGLTFIPGVEISSTYWDKEIHLLVYGVTDANPTLSEILSHNMAIRNEQNDAIARLAISENPNLTFEDYERFERNPINGGWKSENFLKNHGIAQDLNQFFTFARRVPQMLFLHPKALIPKLKKEGYTIILAHPPAYFGGDLLPEGFLTELLAYGLDGIECYSPYFQDKNTQKHYIDFCNQRHLLISCGSDHHGDFIPDRALGVVSESVNIPFEGFSIKA